MIRETELPHAFHDMKWKIKSLEEDIKNLDTRMYLLEQRISQHVENKTPSD